MQFDRDKQPAFERVRETIESAMRDIREARSRSHEPRPIQVTAADGPPTDALASTAAVGLSQVEQLERLADLHDRGVVTEEEFQDMKRKILN